MDTRVQDDKLETGNPLSGPQDAVSFDTSSVRSPTAADIEVALGGLRDGSVSAQEVARLWDARLQVETARLLDERLGQRPPPASLDGAVRAIFARLTEAPSNWHQATIFFLTARSPEDVGLRARAPVFFAAGVLIVFMQCATTIGVLTGTFAPACETSDQCQHDGTFCEMTTKIGSTNRCFYCGSHAPLVEQIDEATGVIYNQQLQSLGGVVRFNGTFALEVCGDPAAAVRKGLVRDGGGGLVDGGISAEGIISWCDSCVHVATGTVDPLTEAAFFAAHIAAMGIFDKAAAVFASFIVGLALVGELKDVELCSMAIERARDDLSAPWRFALIALNGVRRWQFVPQIVLIIFFLVASRGGDALSICFNSVAMRALPSDVLTAPLIFR
jgi:hypothetical protein